ncbi:MAG: hemolysin family protein [Gammaproteobacteria bacterium]
MTQLALIAIALLLVLLNGFFVAAEFSLVKLRHTQVISIEKLFGVRSHVLTKVHSQLDTYLSACQLGITLASLGLGWVGEPAFARLLEPLLHGLNIFSPATIRAIAFFTAFFTISFLHIVIGELAPKSLAIRQPQRMSLWTALPLYCFYWLMYPFIALLNSSAQITLKLLGKAASPESGVGHYSAEELKLILHASKSHGDLEKEEAEILDNVLDFADLKVADIMRPAEELITLCIDAPFEKNLEIMAHYRYSRYPVYEKDPQHLIGFLHVKDVFFPREEQPSLRQLMRPLLLVPTDLPALQLFQRFRAGLTHFAVVKHVSGAIVGFITLDNILNTLLGQMRDEFNKTNPAWIQTKEGGWLMKGNTPLYVLEKLLNITLPEMEANTITGLLLTQLQRMPKLNETTDFDEFTVTTLKIKGQRILLVNVQPKISEQ